MKKSTQSLTTANFDLLIVGGGIFGACAAFDACLRGLKVALIDRGDFGAGASANCYKVVHGGIRYMQHADIVRVRESCAERTAMIRNAPHLVSPQPILIPTYGNGINGRALLAAGMFAYDALTCDRNLGVADDARKVPWTKVLSKDEVLKLFPGLPDEGLTGATVFCDGQIYSPPRLVLAYIESAAKKGAVVANYIEALSLIIDDGRVAGANVRDVKTGVSFQISAQTTLVAGGQASESLVSSPDSEIVVDKGTYSRDACFVISRDLNSEMAIAIQGGTKDPDALVSRSARHLFLMPWRGRTLVGVWHKVQHKGQESIEVSREEVTGYVNEVNAGFPGLNLSIDEVTHCNAGLVPFGEVQSSDVNLSYGKRSRLIDHKETSQTEGLVTLIGIRFTMGRIDAERAVDMVLKKLGIGRVKSRTRHTRVAGGEIENFSDFERDLQVDLDYLDADIVASLARNHGSNVSRIANLISEDSKLATPLGDSLVIGAEVVSALRFEMAQSLSDIVFRRTDLCSAGNPGARALEDAAAIAAAEADWSAAETTRQLDEVHSEFLNWLAPVESIADQRILKV